MTQARMHLEKQYDQGLQFAILSSSVVCIRPKEKICVFPVTSPKKLG